MVERARAKRAWEKTLPSLSDVTQLPQRLRMMQEQEAREWAWREGEIQKTQNERLVVSDSTTPLYSFRIVAGVTRSSRCYS